MENNQSEFQLNLSVSNQSLVIKEVDLEIKLDGREVFRRRMETGTQHNWEQLTIPVTAGEHQLEVRESRNNVTQTQALRVERDLWVMVICQGPPPQIGINVFDKQMGII